MSKSLISLLHEASGLHPLLVEHTLKRAPYTYKQYFIDKRSGGRRLIAQPAKETKLLQRWLIEHVFSSLPIHNAATAYGSGMSIAKNAKRHSGNPYLLKLDFSNFFNSITINDIVSFLTAHIADAFSQADIKKIAEVSCFCAPGGILCLSVGAPSSPILSNLIMFQFDQMIDNWCRDRHIVYSRYADDLTFSTKRRGICSEILPVVRGFLGAIAYPRITLNEEKTVYSSKKFRREVTGLIIDNDEKISIGRERKRKISAMIHKFKIGALSEGESYRLQGLLGFAADAEPDFVARMNAKYGVDCLSSIFALRMPENAQ